MQLPKNVLVGRRNGQRAINWPTVLLLAGIVGVVSDAAGGMTDARKTRAALEEQVKTVAGLRREIQYAADLLWPAGIPANAGVRAEFQIPQNRA